MMEVLASKHLPDRGEFHLVRELDVDGPLNLMVLPEETLEWRAAEYQIEPTATDLLLDIVLYEGFLPEDDRQLRLLSAQSIETARLSHIDRVMNIKKALRPQGPGKWKTKPERKARLAKAHPKLAEDWEPHLTDDALQSIRDNHVMEPEVLREKALTVAQHRQDFARRLAGPRRPASRLSASERIERLRAARQAPMEPNLEEM